MKTPIVFSLVKQQSVFMTAIMALLTFLSVLALGISLSIGTGVLRWNSQWDLFATVQILDSDNKQKTEDIINNNQDKIETVNKISTQQMTDLMKPWLTGDGALKNYLPTMYELKFKTKGDLVSIGQEISNNARFLTHSDALNSSMSAGWKMILISVFVLGLMLAAIGISISYIAKNTALLHKRELEILNQIGANDAFVSRQMQRIVAKISSIAALTGFCIATPVLLLIISAAHSARVGLMAMINISGFGWTLLFLLPVSIVIFSIYITRKTTLNILKNS